MIDERTVNDLRQRLTQLERLAEERGVTLRYLQERCVSLEEWSAEAHVLLLAFGLLHEKEEQIEGRLERLERKTPPDS